MIFAYPSTSMYDQPGSVPGLVEFQITGYSTNPVDPVAGPLPAPGVYVQITQYSTDPNFNGTGGAQEQISTSALITGTGPDQGTGTNLYVSNADGTLNMLRFDIANLSPQDVGTAIAFETFDATPAADTSGHALSINSNGTEGGVVQVSLPSVSASALGLSSITVLPPQVVDWQNNILGTANNAAATADAEGRVQNALDAISYARAQVGAQSVSLQEDAGDASLDIVNQIASESAIRDVNVAQTTSDFVKDQLLTQIGVSMISQMQVNAQLVVQLLSQSTATSAPAGTSPGTSLL
jgi:flagellin-like hook-associated protein FlgL